MPYFGVPIRNGLPIGLGSQAGFGIAPFDPRDLFSAGEQGAWYDPSDYSTLFTDSAGTTPVTAVEQFVGLMLDKSKGLVLGPELVTTAPLNGTVYPFSTFTTSGTLITSAINSPGSSVAGAYWDLGSAIPIGTTLRVNLTIAVNGVPYNTFFGVGVNTSGAPSISSNNFRLTTSGTYSFFLTITGANARYLTIGQDAAPFNFAITAISVKQIAGNHATSTGTKRPKLAARYNLLTYSEQFDNAAWGKGGIDAFGSGSVANATAAPDGTNTADLIKENTVNTSHWVRVEAQLAAASTQYVFSVYAKNIDRDYITVAFRGASSNYASATFNLTGSGAVSSSAALGAGYAVNSATISSVGNGWFRCVLTFTTGTNVSSQSSFLALSNNGALNTDGIPSYTGTGLTLYQWGADLRPASQATGLIGPTYQRVVDAATYDTAGYLPYLSFDGIDDSMSTGSIDFTATDKMTVWAGVRKQAAGLGMIAELSASVSANNGTFYFAANNGTNDYGVSLKGTAQATYQPATYTNPITNVISAAFDIGAAAIADENKPRVNGVLEQDNPTGADAGTGNFGNYALFIGARNNASLYFNGWLSSLIVRGAQSTQSQIEATESWVNGRTGAF